MGKFGLRYHLAAFLTLFPLVGQSAPLTPNEGAISFIGTLTDGDGKPGSFAIEAELKDGDFIGRGRIVTSDHTVRGDITQGFLENGRCSIRIESGRAHGDISGKCDSDKIDGQFETFYPGSGSKLGAVSGMVRTTAEPAADEDVPLPTVKLTCVFQDRKVSFKWGEPIQYSLAFSNLGSLTLTPEGLYKAGTSTEGQFVRIGDKIRLVSGTWSGAIGSIERDRSGEPAVIFYIEKNRGPDGTHLVDPYTTHCTQAR
ncbi:hypothetical protein [Pseudaminobacter soli (ex Li et al. 2025)]|uniref:hypothetical protein n=1 Tax=Pseudaminobacter soli (ex Li et al. 2025) TaxID=1295366 RepID=UPI0011B26DF1|nr:hypothetical protein [Mesorhizobium soli]